MNDDSRTPEQALADLDGSHLACRTFGHAWLLESTPLDEEWGRAMIFTCRTCCTVKQEVWGAGGAVLSRTYSYPEGYQFVGTGWTVRRSDGRQEFLRRVEGPGSAILGFRSRRRGR